VTPQQPPEQPHSLKRVHDFHKNRVDLSQLNSEGQEMALNWNCTLAVQNPRKFYPVTKCTQDLEKAIDRWLKFYTVDDFCDQLNDVAGGDVEGLLRQRYSMTGFIHDNINRWQSR
jgi:hypothetical protein